jgi:ketosteroid isomerase-like protein
MSERDVEILHRAFERWNANDIDGTLAFVAHDVRWYPGGVFPDFGDVYEGRGGVRAFFELFMSPWKWISIEILDLREVGDELVLSVRFRAESHEGVDVDMRLGQRYEIRDDLLRRFYGYTSFEEALEAAAGDA